MPKLFVIGDTHFMHHNIIKYTGRDPEFEKQVIANWNSVVGEDDMVIHLGDLSAGVKGRMQELYDKVNSLNGNRILIRGNHDHFSDGRYINDMGFEAVYEYMIADDILFVHYPLEITSYSKPNEIKRINFYSDLVKQNNIKHVVHGHTHGRDTGIPGHFNCSVEQISMCPVELDKLINKENICQIN